ncbi:carbohydrate kinase family protein [Patescibacteria group bacterium]|nr:carbohydrate kinase family protein [Patescibacteria group bacterium]
MRILVSGSVAYDRIMNFPGNFEDFIIPDEIHKLNVSFSVKKYTETFGGAAGNIAYNLSLLEEKSFLYAAVGSDFLKYENYLKKLKVNLSGIKKYKKILSASANIITDQKNNQITGFFAGAMNFSAKIPRITKDDLAIIAPGNPNEMLDLVELYNNKKVPFIFDPGQQIIQFTKNQLRQAIKQCSIYIVNDYELSLTQKITAFTKDILLKNSGVLITTLGAKGSVVEIIQKNKSERIGIRAVKPRLVSIKDPTGAGDAYRSGIIKGIIISNLELLPKNYLQFPWLKIGQLASLAAVYAVENYGTQAHKYTYDQFKNRYFKEFKLKI